MEEYREMEEVGNGAPVTDRTLACCLCTKLLRDAVLLTCLHNCCRQCFSAAVAKSNNDSITCGSCDFVTLAGTEQSNRFIDYQVQRYMSAAESRMCDVCKENGEPYEPAAVWCAVCRLSLCGACAVAHRQYMRLHATQPLEGRLSAPVCVNHNKTVEIACRNCERLKCINCCADCLDKKHDVCRIDTDSFESYIGDIINSISLMDSTLLLGSKALEKPRVILRNLTAKRAVHLKEIQQRKLRIMDAVERAFREIQLSAENTYDEVEGEVIDAIAAADRVARVMSDARTYIRLLLESGEKCEIINQQQIVRERLSVLSAEVDAIGQKRKVTVTINAAPLPYDLENMIREWIGKPVHTSETWSFSATPKTLKLPVRCFDVALTKDGRRLLAAAYFAEQRGLVELSCSNGLEQSRWLPPKLVSGGQHDSVQSVAALSDGRAAVSLLYAQLVVLLKRSECTRSGMRAATAGDAAWTEDRRFDLLPWQPGCLSAHGDVLAVAQSAWNGKQLQLLSLSSGKPLSSERQREYSIHSLAVAARVVVTVSLGKVDIRPRAVQVLDAHCLEDGDKQLWRRPMPSSSSEQEEELWGICASDYSDGGCLYAAVWRRDRSSSRVCSLSLSDGSWLQHVELSYCSAAAHPLLLPWRLSLSFGDGAAAATEQQRQQEERRERALLLAALCSDESTVTLHRSRQQTSD